MGISVARYRCFFEIQNTRSGSVPSRFLKESRARYLLSDVLFQVTARPVSDVNEYREERGPIPTEECLLQCATRGVSLSLAERSNLCPSSLRSSDILSNSYRDDLR